MSKCSGGSSKLSDKIQPSLPTLKQMGSVIGQEIETLPDRIVGYYTDDFNIIDVHNLIMKRFHYQRTKRIENLKNIIQFEKSRLLRLQTVIDKKTTLNTIDKLTNELSDLINNEDINRYLKEATPLIDRYRSIGSVVKVVFFKSKKQNDPGTQKSLINPDEMSPEYRERLLVIESYLDVAKKFGNISVDVVRDISTTNECSNCHTDLTELFNENDNGLVSCPKCGLEKLNLVQIIYTEQGATSGKLTNIHRSGYEDRDNFYKGLLRYQGKQQNRLPTNIVDILDAYFTSFGLLEMTSSRVKEKPLNKNGSRGETTKDMMLKALSDSHTNLSGYYDDLNLICHVYWGWRLPDVSHLENIIMSDYDETQKIFDAHLKNGGSNINIQYRLFKHLELRGHQCKLDDFKMIKGRDILERYDATWKIMIEGAAHNNPHEPAYRFIKTAF